MKNKFVLTFFLFLSIYKISVAQQYGHEKFHSHHTFGIVISHTQVSQGVQENGEIKWMSLPSWGLNYNFKFSPKWSIGIHNDIIVEDFAVEENHAKSSETNKVLERSYPIASAIMVSFKPAKHFSFLLGGGGEFAHSGNYFLVRTGAEYGYHINKDWELNVNLTYDFKIKAYNSWAIGMGMTKIF